MKKYNRTEIMKRAHTIRRIDGSNMSEALTKSWKLAKLEILKGELFLLNMKDISGGRTNAAAHSQIRANNEAIDRLQKEISVLKREIYPGETKVEKIYRYTEAQIEMQRKALSEFKEGGAVYQAIKESLISMEKSLENPEIRTYIIIDENAYNAA
jgi:hypothetical protein